MARAKKRVELAPDITAEDLRLYNRLRAALDEKRAEDERTKYFQRRVDLLQECPHPLALARKFMPSTIRLTPAMEFVSKKWVDTINTYDGRLTTSVGPQQGKAVYVGEEVLTTAGWKEMGQLDEGDEVFHPDGHPVRVTAAYAWQDNRPCYRVTTTDGRSLVVDGEHLWTVQDQRYERSKGVGKDRTRWFPRENLTTEQLLGRGIYKCKWTRPNGREGKAFAYRLPVQRPIVSKPVDLPIDPYVLGAWLGDGETAGAGFTCNDPEIVDQIRATGLTVERKESGGPYAWYISRRGTHRRAEEEARALVREGVPGREAMRRVGLPIGSAIDIVPLTPSLLRVSTEPCAMCHDPDRKVIGRGLCGACYQAAKKAGTIEQYEMAELHPWLRPELYRPRIRSFQHDLRELGVLGDKHIPEQYLTAGTEQRLALLQGLMDTDGSIYNTGSSFGAEFCSCNEELATGVLFLVRSLGWRVTAKESAAKLNGREVGRRWRVCFTPQRGEMVPFRLTRKVDRIQEGKSRAGERHAVSIASIEPVDSCPVRCIKVDSEDGLFLAGRDLVATHNTVTSRWAVFWALLDDPDRRVVYTSYGMSLARQSGREIRGLVRAFGADYGLFEDESHADAADWGLRGFAGGVLSASVDSTLTGRPADIMVLDDLLPGEKEANSEAERTKVHMWWESTARLRMAPGVPVVSIGTRWSIHDILSRFIEEGWDRINIPALAETGILDSIADIPGARTPDGYLVSTRGTTPEDYDLVRREIGERSFYALLQGSPAPVAGGIFLNAWFDDHRIKPEQLPQVSCRVVAVDPAETGLGDEAGIIVASVGLADRHIYIEADLSAKLSQYAWARKVCLAWIRFKADRIVQERTLGQQGSVNQAWSLLRRQAVALVGYGDPEKAAAVLEDGGDSAAADIASLSEIVNDAEAIVDAGAGGPRVVTLTPRQSKRVRAESATQPFETGRAHLCGRLDKLQHEATTWVEGAPSPNRLDCLALVVNHLDRGSRSKLLV